MRVAIVGQTYYPGNNGQAIFTIHLAEGLAKAGHEVHMLTPGLDHHYRKEIINGVTLHTLKALPFNWLHPGASLSLFPGGQIRSIFKQSPPDIIHLQDHYFLSRDVILAARRKNLPVIGTNHFLPENVLPYLNVLPLPNGLKINILWALMLWTYNTLELVTTPTETAANILRQQTNRMPIIPVSCGVNTNHFVPNPALDREATCAGFGLDPQKILFLYVGRQDREKRIDLLLRALAQLIKAGRTDIQLAIGGQGAFAGDLKSLAHSLGLEKYVKFLGYVPDEQLPTLYQTAHIFTMPSPEELQSIATLEAMASARPILAANARALPELVGQGANGFLFQPGKVESVMEGMNYLIDHRDDWDRMGIASRSRAVAHSLESTIRRYEEIYANVREAHQKAAGKSFKINFKAIKSE